MLEDDIISLDEDFHHRSAILDALDQMEVDEDPDADETNNDVVDDITCLSPKLQNPIPSAFRETATTCRLRRSHS
jgi:hypothetical protein